MLRKSYLNKEVKVRFYDHFAGASKGDALPICVVWGRIIEIGDKDIVVAYWDLESTDKSLVDTNRERVNIIQSAIIDISILRSRSTKIFQR